MVQIVDGRCKLLMAGMHCQWQVWVIDGWCGSGHWVVWVWLLGGGWLALLAIVGLLGGVGLVVGLSLGSHCCWVIGKCYSSLSCTVGIGYGHSGGCAVMAVVSIVVSTMVVVTTFFSVTTCHFKDTG